MPDNIIEWIKTILNNKVVIGISSGLAGSVVSAFIVHILYKSKLKKEQKVRFENVVGDKIAESLFALRQTVKKVTVVEVYDIENQSSEQISKIDFFSPSDLVYPAIFTDSESLNAYIVEIRNIRMEHDDNLDCETAAYLHYAERYFLNLRGYLLEKHIEFSLAGTVFLKDINDWFYKFFEIIAKKLNSSKCKLEVHAGRKWEKAKKKVTNQLWNGSVLNEFRENPKNGKYDKLKYIVESLSYIESNK